jgi:uncharacterized membrane protein YhaH (DUF805 family)
MKLNPKKDLLTTNGRINRQTYWTYTGIFIGIWMVIGLLIFIFSSIVGESTLENSPFSTLILIILALLALLMGIISIMLGIKRFHDRGKSGWWMLLSLIPYIGGLWILVECGFLPGDEGSNKYGEPQA